MISTTPEEKLAIADKMLDKCGTCHGIIHPIYECGDCTAYHYRLKNRSKINYRRIFFDVVQHFSDVRILYLLFSGLFALLWLFFISISINENLMKSGTIDTNSLYKSVEIMRQMFLVSMGLGILGYMCRIWILIQDLKIKQSIIKYKLDVIR